MGYPGDKSPSQSQWIGADEVNYTGTQQVYYRTDTYGGESGSAVWYDRPSGTTGSLGPYAYAIHAYGIHGSYPHTINHGTRITQSVFNNLIAWRAAL
jgi:glutamyl endopeptidase